MDAAQAKSESTAVVASARADQTGAAVAGVSKARPTCGATPAVVAVPTRATVAPKVMAKSVTVPATRTIAAGAVRGSVRPKAAPAAQAGASPGVGASARPVPAVRAGAAATAGVAATRAAPAVAARSLAPVAATTGKLWQKPVPKRQHESDDDSDGSWGSDLDVEAPHADKVARVTTRASSAARGKMRMTAGEVKEARRSEFMLRAERDVADLTVEYHCATAPNASASRVPASTAELVGKATKAITYIAEVGRKSKNIKGELLGGLKLATASISDAVAELSSRTTAEESRLLAEENGRLRAELAAMRRDMQLLKEEMQALRRAAPVADAAPVDEEGRRRSIMEQVGTMVNARLESLEGRLLPEPRLRPPLAAAKCGSYAAAVGRPAPARAAPPRAVPPARPTARSVVRTVVGAAARAAPPARVAAPMASRVAAPAKVAAVAAPVRTVLSAGAAARAAPVAPPRAATPAAAPRVSVAPAAVETVVVDDDMEEEVIVEDNAQPSPAPEPRPAATAAQAEAETAPTRRRRRGGRRRKTMAGRRVPDAENAGTASSAAPGGPRGPARVPPSTLPPTQLAARKLRPARSAAVVLTLQPAAIEEGVTYARVIAEARSKIDLASLDIERVQFRVSATGARMLEVAGGGAAAGVKADALARRLTEELDATQVRVSRPVKSAELRLSGFDESVTAPEIAAAVARVGACEVTAVTCGEVRYGRFGSSVAWVRCPVPAARAILMAGRLTVGWGGSARVELLETRPLRCFKCLEPGHTRALCPSEEDRSDQCYRCGESGHKAGACHAKPRCTLCAAAGRPAEHRCGTKACAAPKKRGVAVASGGPSASSQPERPTPPGAGAGTAAAGMDTAS